MNTGKKNKTYGYVRVSAQDQNESRQLEALRACKFSIAEENIFIDKKSGKDFLRPAWKRLMKKLQPGDLIIVKSIDRLGRNYEEILEQWKILTKDKEVNIIVLDMPLLDTRSKGKDLTGTFIADLVLQILSYVAQTERENIRQRQLEGIALAKANGIHFGRTRMDIPVYEETMQMWRDGEITGKEAAQRCGISRQALYKRMNAEKKQARLKVENVNIEKGA